MLIVGLTAPMILLTYRPQTEPVATAGGVSRRWDNR